MLSKIAYKNKRVFFTEGNKALAEWLLEKGLERVIQEGRTLNDRFIPENVSLLETPYGEFVLKRFTRGFRRSKALRELRNGYALLKAGIPSVAPVVALRTKTGDYALSPYKPNLISGINLVWGGLWEKLDEMRRKEVIKKVCQLVASLHNADFVHGDLNSSNLLFENLYKGDMRVYLIDLGSVRGGSLRGYVKDVARLWRSTRHIISIKSGLRFLLFYCALRGYNPRPFLAAVVKRVRYLDKHRPQKG